MQRLFYIFWAGIFFLTSCHEDVYQPDDPLRPESSQINAAREYFEGAITRAATAGVKMNTKTWSPGEITPAWEDATRKKDEQYEYLFIPVYTQNKYVAEQRVRRDSVMKYYHVRVSQLLAIRQDKEGKYSMVCFSLIPSKGYYTANKNKVEQKFLESPFYYGDFTGRIAYHDVASGRLMGVDKVNKGTFEWGFWKDGSLSKQELKAYYRKMFDKISVFQIMSTRGDPTYDGGELEDADIYWCKNCNENVELGHVCPDDNEDQEEQEEGDNDNSESDEDNENTGGSWGGGGGGNGSEPAPATPFIDKICKNSASLSAQTRRRLEKCVKNLKSKYTYAAILFDKIYDGNFQITIKIDPNMPKSISYNHSTHTLTFFKNNIDANVGTLEDWAHVAQCEIYYKDNKPSNRNLEFEAKMFCDINCQLNGNEACSILLPGFKQDMTTSYIDFKSAICSSGSFNSADLGKYYQFGDAWNDPNYQSGTFRHRPPLMLLDLVK